MPNFRKLDVYKLSRSNTRLSHLHLKSFQSSGPIADQLARASLSVTLNIAEGSTRFGVKDERKFYIIARSSANECGAIYDVIEDMELLDRETCSDMRSKYEQASYMLYKMIKRLE